jgi:hypothetical protein
MSLTLVTSSGEQHGLINTVGNSVPDDNFKRFAEKDRVAMEKLKKEECRMVKARYLNSRGPHEKLEKPYCRWAGQPITMWKFLHDHVYEVPKGLIDEVNRSPGLPKRSEILDANGKPTIKDGTPERLHSFVPVEF